MNSIKLIPIEKLDDNGWLQYYNVDIKIGELFIPGNIPARSSWQNFKDDKIKEYEIDKLLFRNILIISDKDELTGWIDYKLLYGEAVLDFDTVYCEIPDALLKVLFNKIYEFLCERNINNSYLWTFCPRKIKAFKNAGVQVSEEILIARMERENMIRNIYEEIVNKTNLSGYTIQFMNTFPDDLISRYTVYMNEILSDVNRINPFKTELRIWDDEFWRKKFREQEESISEMKMFMLFDHNNDITGHCIVYVDPDKKDTVRHNGGFTAVSSKNRRKGFARFLKAKMYLKLLDENNDFKYITTDTMPWNTYMYRINEEFGFKPYKHGYDFKLTKEFLENYLKNY